MQSDAHGGFASLWPYGRLWFNLLATAIFIAAAVTTVSALIAILYPELRPLLLKEDGIIEMGSVLFLTIAVLGAVATACLWGAHPPVVLAGLIGFAELMDETSFGSRLLRFEPPPLYGGGQLDGFHDLLILAYRLLHNVNQGLAWLWAGLMLAVTVAVLLVALCQLAKEMSGTISRLGWHILLLLHIGFIGLAQVIDVATSTRILSAAEEVLELNAAILLAFYVAQQASLSWRPVPFIEPESRGAVRQARP